MTSKIIFSSEWQSRSAELRTDSDAISRLWDDSQTRIAAMWRGRALVSGDDQLSVVWLNSKDPILQAVGRKRIFLGHHDGIAHFAADMSKWMPQGADPELVGAPFDLTEYTHPLAKPGQRFCDLRAIMTRIGPVDASMVSTARAVLNWHRSHKFCAACGHPSEMILAGWQRSCPSCGTQHFPRTDPVVIMLVERGNKLLLGRSPGWPEGMFSALAGFVEPGESLETAVRREVFEETGIHIGDVKYVASQPWAWPNSLMLGFVAQALSDEITLDQELDDAIWLTREEMVDVMAGLHPDVKKPRRGAIASELVTSWLKGDMTAAQS